MTDLRDALIETFRCQSDLSLAHFLHIMRELGEDTTFSHLDGAYYHLFMSGLLQVVSERSQDDADIEMYADELAKGLL